MAGPPSYEESTGGVAYSVDNKHDSKQPQRWNLQAEVGATREQHAMAVAYNLAPQIRSRAHRGLAKSTFFLVPKAHGGQWPDGELVDLFDDQVPIQIQLDSALDTAEFWSQKEPLNLLRSKLLSILGGETPSVQTAQAMSVQRGASSKKPWWSRKQNSSSTSHPGTSTPQPKAELAIEVDARLGDAHFRKENAAGLWETSRIEGVLVAVHVR